MASKRYPIVKSILPAVVGLLALAGCSNAPAPQTESPASETGPVIRPLDVSPGDDPIATARTLDDAPDWVAVPQGTDCGSDTLDQGETLPSTGPDCLARAVKDGQGAHYAWAIPTVEGDPIVLFARTVDGGVEVVETTEFDTFGTPGWSSYRCDSPGDISFIGSCERVGDE